ncbi:MAG: hypothetical protein FWE34_07460 [Defluviitaleaceae bacterium]|nr:hypothetical protein [Defluviitaleaceae bacterium]
MSLDFTVYTNNPLITPNGVSSKNAYEGELELIKPLLLYADQIGVVSHSINSLALMDYSETKGVARNSEEFSILFNQTIEDARSVIQLIDAGLVKSFIHGSASELIGHTDDEEVIEFLSSLNNEQLSNLHLLYAMDTNSYGGAPVYSQNAYKLYEDFVTKSSKVGGVTSNPTAINKTTHLLQYLALKLPNFGDVPIDEILDIRKELAKPLIHFRKEILILSDEIKHVEGSQSIGEACKNLYYTRIAPALQDIEDETKTNSFVKNLGYNIFSDEKILRSSFITIGVMVSSALATMAQMIPFDLSPIIPAIIPTADTAARVASKAVKTVKEHSESMKEDRKKLEGNGLYFLHATSEKLKK